MLVHSEPAVTRNFMLAMSVAVFSPPELWRCVCCLCYPRLGGRGWYSKGMSSAELLTEPAGAQQSLEPGAGQHCANSPIALAQCSVAAALHATIHHAPSFLRHHASPGSVFSGYRPLGRVLMCGLHRLFSRADEIPF